MVEEFEHKTNIYDLLYNLKTMRIKQMSSEFIGTLQWNWNSYDSADTFTGLDIHVFFSRIKLFSI